MPQAPNPASLPCPRLPGRQEIYPPDRFLIFLTLGKSPPVARFNFTISLTNSGESRKCRAVAIALGPMARRWLTPVAVAFLDKGNHARSKLNRM